MIVYTAPFDPITDDELQQLKNYHKQTGMPVALAIVGDGILNYNKRKKLCMRACSPYRYLHVVEIQRDDTCIALQSETETEVRKGYFYLSAKGIHKILLENGYYFEEVTKAQCNPKRAAHSVRVAHTAYKLANIHHLNKQLAYQMGLLHDVTKKMSDEEGYQLLSHFRPEILKLDPAIWHSYTAVIWLKQNLGCYNKKILQAIEHHTLGDGKSAYDYILYIADKIEPGRHYDVTMHTKIAERNLKQGAEYVLADAKKYILEKEGKHV